MAEGRHCFDVYNILIYIIRKDIEMLLSTIWELSITSPLLLSVDTVGETNKTGLIVKRLDAFSMSILQIYSYCTFSFLIMLIKNIIGTAYISFKISCKLGVYTYNFQKTGLH